MKLEDIIESWEKDGPVDAINITNESANTPKLHNKYFKIYMGEGYILRKMKAEYKLKKERWKKEMESQETPKSQRNQGNAYCFDKQKKLTHSVTQLNRSVKANIF